MDIQLELILRVFCAAMLGGLIGLEREYRAKEAGFRTHFLVALGSALFMIVSAYGFSGTMSSEEQRWDVSRVAAQVVSGIGFIGAGTIIFHKSQNIVRGLTTAAGLWVTAAIGLACGGGMYILSVAATLLVLAGLEAFNFFLRRLDTKRDLKANGQNSETSEQNTKNETDVVKN
ncbi:magnesium transporter MgtC [Pseudoprevotella muciniphila]|uniref:Magnesium transporter MgtC n=1 Tax=Pseudoprevotella muciniphila TaxID=2133944 RepID=A0A5P8E3S9_9BACT|nr:MgtC/SapB family protein [Pseudoprevotella muciniphila]QFQ11602.1 magnesium transporter MgtC [Pseudoprevotella muciniphila]